MFTIAIATHKGGTGKTSSSMALAAALSRAGKASLLVDLDPQGHSTLGLGVQLEEGELAVRDLFSEGGVSIQNVATSARVPRLDVLPSDIRLARMAQGLYMRPKREDLLKRSLDEMRSRYEF